MREIINLCLERKRLMKLKVNTEESLQPVCLTDEQAKTEIVVCMSHRRKTRQGREFRGNQVGETLFERTEVEMSLECYIGKVALEADEVNTLIVA